MRFQPTDRGFLAKTSMEKSAIISFTVITKPEEHDTNRAGRRLLRAALETLGWVVNEVQEDYGIDSKVQIFDGTSPTGAWFQVQL